jgi:putative hydrolase
VEESVSSLHSFSSPRHNIVVVANGDSNPFHAMLRDLMGMLGHVQGGNDAWIQTATALATSVASGGESPQNPDPLARLRFEELRDVVVRQVGVATDGIFAGTLEAATLECLDRVSFAQRQFAQWKDLIAPLVTMAPPLTKNEISEHGDAGMSTLMAGLATTIGPSLVGMQYGSAAGHLAERALGASAVVLPWTPSSLVVIPDNVAAYAADWSLPLEGAQIFALARECVTFGLLSLDHIGAEIRRLVGAWIIKQAGSQQSIVERLQAEAMDPQEFSRLIQDPESILSDLLAPVESTFDNALVTLSTVVAAYADHIGGVVTEALHGTSAPWREAWQRRRLEEGSHEQNVGALLGLDLSPSRVEEGTAFLHGIIERAGEGALSGLWWPKKNRPTTAEFAAPGLWLARIEVED